MGGIGWNMHAGRHGGEWRGGVAVREEGGLGVSRVGGRIEGAGERDEGREPTSINQDGRGRGV